MRIIIEKLLKIPQLLEIIVVDDLLDRQHARKSRKNLAAEHESISYVKQPKNEGKTSALRTGFALTKGGSRHCSGCRSGI